MSAGLDPDVQALAETIGKMRAALIRCGVTGPFVLQVPANSEGFDFARKLKHQRPCPLNEHHHRGMDPDIELIGVLTGLKLRFYEPERKR